MDYIHTTIATMAVALLAICATLFPSTVPDGLWTMIVWSIPVIAIIAILEFFATKLSNINRSL